VGIGDDLSGINNVLIKNEKEFDFAEN